MKSFSLRTKLYLVSALLIVTAAGLGLTGLDGIRKTNAGLETVYNDRVVPLEQLKRIADAYAVDIIDAINKANAGLVSAEETVKRLDAASAAIAKYWTDYRATTLTVEEAKLATEAADLFLPANRAVSRARGLLTALHGNVAGQLQDFDGPLYATIDPISGKINELVELQLRVAKSEYDRAQERYRLILMLTSGGIILALLVGGGLSVTITQRVTSSIDRITTDLALGAEQTAAAAHQVSSSSQQLAHGASEQAASLEETSASLAEIDSMTRRNAENSRLASTAAQHANEVATHGVDRMATLQEAMRAIDQSSTEISKILRSIDDIAFQTNILALNAAVEAARAGTAGAGFAVVADEVRALATRSADAARETSSLVERSVSHSRRGVELTDDVSKDFSAIQTEVQQLERLIGDISRATHEQSEGLGQISKAVSQMDKVTQVNAAGAEEGASASEELNSQANAVNESVHVLDRLVHGTSADSPRAPVQVASPASAKRRSTLSSQPAGV